MISFKFSINQILQIQKSSLIKWLRHSTVLSRSVIRRICSKLILNRRPEISLESLEKRYPKSKLIYSMNNLELYLIQCSMTIKNLQRNSTNLQSWIDQYFIFIVIFKLRINIKIVCLILINKQRLSTSANVFLKTKLNSCASKPGKFQQKRVTFKGWTPPLL